MTTIKLTDELATMHAGRLVAWAEANGLDPDNIPVPSSVLIAGSEMTVELYVRDRDGWRTLDEDSGETLRESVTVDIREPFPADLIDEDGEHIDEDGR